MNGLSNFAEIISNIKTLDIICACESWSTSPNLSLQGIQGFEVIVSPAFKAAERGRARGGLFIALNPIMYKYNVIINNSDFICVDISENSNSFNICLCYCSPLASFHNFIENPNNILLGLLHNYPAKLIIVI